MHWIWLTGALMPTAMGIASVVAHLRRHRWRWPITVGAAAGVTFCGVSWLLLRYALQASVRVGEILFLQIAFATVGGFVFGVVAMVTARFVSRVAVDRSIAPENASTRQ